MHNKLNDAGQVFSWTVPRRVITASLLVAVGLALVILVTHHKAAIVKAATVPADQATMQATITSPSSSTIAATQNYLYIKEWGIQFPLPASLQGAYYVPAMDSKDATDGLPDMMWLGLSSLDGDGCSAKSFASQSVVSTSDKPLAAILRVPSGAQDQVSGVPYSQEFPNGVTISNYYYAFDDRWMVYHPCTTKTDMAALRSAFSSSTINSSAATSSATN